MASLGTDPFEETEDQQALRKLARDVAERELEPMARHWDETEEFPQGSWDAIRRADLFGITIGERYGGMGMGDIEAAIVLEELGRACVSSAILAQLTFNGPPRAIEHLGSDALKDRWLPLAASGEALFCIGISETEAGSAVNHIRARLTPDGDGYRLNAYKNYVTGGHKAAACLVWCRFPGSDGTKGIGSVVVDLTADGVSVAGTHEKMGLRGTSEAELAFDDVRIEPGDVLLEGDPSNSESFKTLIGHINHERCGNAAMCIGAAQGALEYAIRYVNERMVGGKPLAGFQGLQWKIADMGIQLEGARLLMQRALHLAGPHGTPPALETAMAKTAANLAAKFVCDEAIQLLGGYGFSREYPVERVYRDIRGLCIGAGTVEIQRNFVGTNLLKGGVPTGNAWRARASEVAGLRATYRHPGATEYLKPGGAWDVPTLDALLSGRDPDPANLDAIARVAGGLRERGVRRGDVVAWQLPNCSRAVLLYRACWRLGAIAGPIHHLAGPVEVEHMLDVLDPVLRVEDDETFPLGEPVTKPTARPAELAVALFTGGSTGAPKAVLHTHRGLAHKALTMVRVHGLHRRDAVLMPAPLAHVSGLLNGLLVPGAAGMRTVLMPRWDPERALQLIETERISFMIGPPTFFIQLMAAPGFTPKRVDSLRLVSSGGAGVTPAFVAEATERLGARVKRSYGSTEAPTITSSTARDSARRAAETDGRPVGECELRLGPDGELLLRGPELFAGYADPAQTREAVTKGWFATGDLATIDRYGWLTIVGRKKDVIIRGGENISAAEVEDALEAHPSIREAIAVGYPDERLGERVCAFVVSDAPFDVEQCRAWFAERGVARFKTPEQVRRVDALPVLAAGKVDRAALRTRAAHPA